MSDDSQTLSEKNGWRYKRVRRAPRGRSEPALYTLRCDCLQAWEDLSEQGQIDVFYGDESGVSLVPVSVYAWQSKEEKIIIPSGHGGQLNCFALLTRNNDCFVRTTEETITGDWLAEQISVFSQTLQRLTVIVLDNAPVHKKMVREHGDDWQERGLYIGFLPPYSPHLNIVEVLWKQLKYLWLKASHYRDKPTLHQAVNTILQGIGKQYTIAFEPFKMPTTCLT